uniref:Uncharacterized protein n=1 Tax=Glossina brevipalpis TaxID=37001 RepID=A0A1A9WC11_9MUSC
TSIYSGAQSFPPRISTSQSGFVVVSHSPKRTPVKRQSVGIEGPLTQCEALSKQILYFLWESENEVFSVMIRFVKNVCLACDHPPKIDFFAKLYIIFACCCCSFHSDSFSARVSSFHDCVQTEIVKLGLFTLVLRSIVCILDVYSSYKQKLSTFRKILKDP